jgi:hypothetical protein
MIKPSFPYKGNQVIITSDRVTLHSKTDGVFLFGKGTVGLSSVQTINLDSKEKVLIDAPKIELGHKAESEGEPIVLGKQLVYMLQDLLIAIKQAATELQTNDPIAAGTTLQLKAEELIQLLNRDQPTILSTNTFTI